MLDRPYRNSSVKVARVTKSIDSQIANLKQQLADKEEELYNAHPSARCKVCGVTGKGLVKVSLGEAYFLCAEHFKGAHSVIDIYVESLITIANYNKRELK